MHCIVSLQNTFESWRRQARVLLAQGIRPEAIVWRCDGGSQDDLFAGAPADSPATPSDVRFHVPAEFLKLAEPAVLHSHEARFALLYRLLWRLRLERDLMQRQHDADLVQARTLAGEVRRDLHKMKAFVRFREAGAGGQGRRSFYAWFEPDHNIVEKVAPFFERRFADMDWLIATPKGTASCHAGTLHFDPAPGRKLGYGDDTEELWRVYFANIFNPARLKISAMTSEMPKKYWKNLPEASLIPDLIATAEARAREMQAKAATQPPTFAARARAAAAAPVEAVGHTPLPSLSELHEAARHCVRCPLHLHATQTVVGAGPLQARLMFVGEQPGDQEDLQGVPLVGPAGEVFNAGLATAGIERAHVYITNAVKHFKFTVSGKLRLHQSPSVAEIQHCKWWLMEEVRLVEPRVIVAMGATALHALTGDGKGITRRRGQPEHGPLGLPIMPTLHPAAILRHPDVGTRERYRAEFFADIAMARQMAA